MAAPERPVAGRHYPRDWDEFAVWFPDDAACVDYLEWLRWPDGFVCPKCGTPGGWRSAKDGKWSCRASDCKRRTSVRAGTIFDRSKVPMTTWFAAAWYVTNQKLGASALGLKAVTGVSYPTAWTMLHKFRTAMVRPGREMLSGRVEVDETLVGGTKPGPRGRGAKGKTLVVIAIENSDAPVGYGRVRMEVIKRAEAVILLGFIRRNIEPGSTVVTDGLKSYESVGAFGYDHVAINITQSGMKAHELLPAVHRAASLVKRWLLGTHQGAVEPAHLQAYLDEFCFRFNRRRSRQRGLLFYRLLELAVTTEPTTFDDIKKNLRMRNEKERANRAKNLPPASSKPRAPRQLDPGRPWRAATPT